MNYQDGFSSVVSLIEEAKVKHWQSKANLTLKPSVRPGMHKRKPSFTCLSEHFFNKVHSFSIKHKTKEDLTGKPCCWWLSTCGCFSLVKLMIYFPNLLGHYLENSLYEKILYPFPWPPDARIQVDSYALSCYHTLTIDSNYLLYSSFSRCSVKQCSTFKFSF